MEEGGGAITQILTKGGRKGFRQHTHVIIHEFENGGKRCKGTCWKGKKWKEKRKLGTKSMI